MELEKDTVITLENQEKYINASSAKDLVDLIIKEF